MYGIKYIMCKKITLWLYFWICVWSLYIIYYVIINQKEIIIIFVHNYIFPNICSILKKVYLDYLKCVKYVWNYFFKKVAPVKNKNGIKCIFVPISNNTS